MAVRARELGQHQTARAQVLKAQTTQVHAHHATGRNAHRVHAQLGQILQTVLQVRARRRARIQRDVVARRKVQSITDQSPCLAFINAHYAFHCRSAQVDRVHVQTGFAQAAHVTAQRAPAEQRVQVVLVTRNSRIRQVDLHVVKAGTAQLLAQTHCLVQLAQVRYI